jgi:2-hydroxy-6-oxonona-2,4-dienedioate hydrolase
VSMWSDLASVSFTLGYVNAGGLRTRTLCAGKGDAIIFLHGTSGHLEAFIRNIPAHELCYACHAIDMLGHGYTDKPDYPFRITRYVEHLLAYMDEQGIEKAHLVGESLGGWVAGRTAADYPERVSGLTLAVPGGTIVDPAAMQRIRASITAAVTSADITNTRKRLEGLMFDPAANVTEELVKIRYDIYMQPSFKRALGNLLCLQDERIRTEDLLTDQQMRKITAPTLIVWGRDNPYGGTPEAERIQSFIAGSKLVVFDECGHWPQHEHAARFNEINLAFMRDN